MTLRRALRLYAAWIAAMALHVPLRIALVLCIPILFAWWYARLGWSQRSAQASFDITGLFMTRWPRFPRLSLTALTKQARRRAADGRIGKRRGKAIPFRPD